MSHQRAFKSNIGEYITSLVNSKRLGPQVAYRTILEQTPVRWSESILRCSPAVQQALRAAGIVNLYRHQEQAIHQIRNGQDVIVATPTASGKSMIYNLPVLERFQADVTSRSLYIFPLKALAQDQLRAFEQLAANFQKPRPTSVIYDGDTSAYKRKRIREAPPNLILTNPEMVHLSFLAHHRKWNHFFENLQTVVVDEVHTYRGVMGSHLAQIFRRFHRICRHYGASPTFVFSSATVANPARLARQLTAKEAAAITHSGAPQGRRHLVFVNPETGPAQAAILLLKAALIRELRTIVYTQSRKLTELITVWAAEQSGKFADRISAYRAGFLPEERRDIENRLSNGELLAVISTSALELGIDIGDLDLCILVGYPGSVVSTWQRGGRVGRSGQESALILIAGEDALDQYFIRNPEDLLKRPPESAVVNPYNPQILAQHVECAAAELPLRAGEFFINDKHVIPTLEYLEGTGILLRDADGDRLYAKRNSPHRRVDIRGSGNQFQIVCRKSGKSRGQIDEFRAFRETHPGAVYLHRGQTFLVDSLDLNTRTITVTPAEVDYYTQIRGYKEIDIIEIFARKFAWGAKTFFGRLKVTDQVTEYEVRRIHGKNLITSVALDLPPQVFETEGMWFQIPRAVSDAVTSKGLDFMGGIHAVEHAAIGVFPLLVMADRNDLGGLSTLFHPQLDSAGVFIFDGIPGGAGLNREAYERADGLLDSTLNAIEGCDCEAGCPSCVQSPKCGSGNRPIDKAAAAMILTHLKRCLRPAAPPSNGDKHPDEPAYQATTHTKPATQMRYAVFDLETQRSAADVGGWHRADLMKISCAVLYDSGQDRYIDFVENQIPQFVEHLQTFDLVVGFNIKRFDYRVLRGYTDFDFMQLNNLDILEEVKSHLGFRLSLDHLAAATLGARKTADGLQALKWWQQGKIMEIIAYCRQDVRLTRDLYRHGAQHGHLLYTSKSQQTLRIPVRWQ
ncbi:MAG: DEAD/DEAH box helicase [Deltaproteobacteria bacterium]|jgi:DEAD/DEAH box helicase domain-containing protein|nr:DEAD/DEAH box helicase [Deltaproteobacteria bacterium]